MNILKKLTLACVAACCLITGTAFAESWYAGSEEGEDAKFTLGVGYLWRDRPYTDYRSTRRHNIIPILGYQGEYFFIEGKDIGFKYVMDDWRFDLIGEYINLGYRESDSSFLSGNDRRLDSFEMGGRVTWQPGDWGLSLYGGHDVTGNSDGGEVRGEVFYRQRFDRWTLRPYANVAWQTSNKVEYYYGVRQEDATVARPAYQGDDVWNGAVGLNVGYDFLDQWKVLASAQYEHYGSEIRDSSIVSHDGQFSAIIGLAYTF